MFSESPLKDRCYSRGRHSLMPQVGPLPWRVPQNLVSKQRTKLDWTKGQKAKDPVKGSGQEFLQSTRKDNVRKGESPQQVLEQGLTGQACAIVHLWPGKEICIYTFLHKYLWLQNNSVFGVEIPQLKFLCNFDHCFSSGRSLYNLNVDLLV